jgi:small basic protein (TIGR04137 family)
MSLDNSLKSAGSLVKHRNVLSRAERIANLNGKDRFDMSRSDPLGLPKVANRKVAAGGKVAKKESAAEGGDAAGAAGAAVATEETGATGAAANAPAKKKKKK